MLGKLLHRIAGIPLLVLALLPVHSLQAQLFTGALGYISGGCAYNMSQRLEWELHEPAALGEDLTLAGPAFCRGGGWAALIGDDLLLGGSGMLCSIKESNSRGTVSASHGGIFLDLGYVAHRSKKAISYPYFRIGSGSFRLNVRNDASDGTICIGNATVQPGAELELASQGTVLDLGWAWKFMVHGSHDDEGSSGALLGVELGTFLFLASTKWRRDESFQVVDMPAPTSWGPYIRISLGGGIWGAQRGG